MKTLIIPEKIIEIPNWIYWLHTKPEIFVVMGVLLIIGLVVLFQYLIMKHHHCP